MLGSAAKPIYLGSALIDRACDLEAQHCRQFYRKRLLRRPRPDLPVERFYVGCT